MPVITAAQLLDWTEGRNSSQFQNVALRQRPAPLHRGSRGRCARLEAMLPASAANGALNSLTRNGQQVARETRTVKGITYHVFAAAAGKYEATYGVPGVTPPPDTDPTPGTGGTGGTTTPGAGGTGGTTKPAARAGRRRRCRRGRRRGGGARRQRPSAARVRSRNVRASSSGKLGLRVEVPARRVALPRDAADPPQRQADRHPPDRDHRAGRDQDGRVQARPQRAARPLQCRLTPGRRNRNHPLGGGFPRDHQEQDQAAGASALGGGPVAIKEDAVPRGVLTTTCAAALAAMAVAAPSAMAAPVTVTDTDFAGGTPAGPRSRAAR